MTASLEIENLCGGYGRIPVLGGVDLRVAPGEIVGVLGHNGMGKTTLVRTVMGFLPATTGRILLAGCDITREPAFRRAKLGLGYVPQGRQIFPALTARDNLRMGCTAAPGDAEPTIERVLQSFPRVRQWLDRVGGSLSGGEQQLLALARCLCGNPKVMLLDEPSEGIQPSILDEIATVLAHIKVANGVSIVLVEQNVEFLSKLADRVLVISKGRIVDERAGADITKEMMDAYAL